MERSAAIWDFFGGVRCVGTIGASEHRKVYLAFCLSIYLSIYLLATYRWIDRYVDMRCIYLYIYVYETMWCITVLLIIISSFVDKNYFLILVVF